MPILPDQSTANTDTNNNIEAATTTAQNQFIAEATVLINNAIANSLFDIEPYLPTLVTSTYVINYFTPLGYTVTFPIYPPGPLNENFVPNFPEVIPPNFPLPFSGVFGLPRIKIAWGPTSN